VLNMSSDAEGDPDYDHYDLCCSLWRTSKSSIVIPAFSTLTVPVRYDPRKLGS
jgi:hypothetical protein